MKYAKYIFLFFVHLFAGFTVIELLQTFILEDIFNVTALKNSGIWGLICISLTSMLYAISAISYKLISRYKDEKLELQLSRTALLESHQAAEEGKGEIFIQTLVKELETSYNEKNWEDVVKMGSVLSRPLWTTGRYSLRIKIGKIVEAAAGFAKNPQVQAQALIDDLGWTNFELGNIAEARKKITHGISIAKEANEYNLTNKGFRHLSGIFLKENKLVEAKQNLDLALAESAKLPDGKEKEIANAGLWVNLALINHKQQHYLEALDLLQKANDIYILHKDLDREVKLYHFKGDILFDGGDLGKAKDTYREGLVLSRKQSRRDGIMKNTLGIANVEFEETDYREALKLYKEASVLAKELGFIERENYCKARITEIENKLK